MSSHASELAKDRLLYQTVDLCAPAKGNHTFKTSCAEPQIDASHATSRLTMLVPEVLEEPQWHKSRRREKNWR